MKIQIEETGHISPWLVQGVIFVTKANNKCQCLIDILTTTNEFTYFKS